MKGVGSIFTCDTLVVVVVHSGERRCRELGASRAPMKERLATFRGTLIAFRDKFSRFAAERHVGVVLVALVQISSKTISLLSSAMATGVVVVLPVNDRRFGVCEGLDELGEGENIGTKLGDGVVGGSIVIAMSVRRSGVGKKKNEV